MTTRKSERRIQNEVRLFLGQQPDLIIWRNNTGSLLDARGIPVRFGLCVGSSDLVGIFKPTGQFCAFELKTDVGQISTAQQLFIDLINDSGGFASIIRSVAQAERAINKLRERHHGNN